MRTRFKLTRDGDAFVARLAPSQTAAMREALIYLRHRDHSDLTLTLQLGIGRETVDALIERLSGGHTESRDIRFRAEELHAMHSALTTAATMFVSREGAFLQEPFHIRLGFYRENFDALAYGIVEAASEV
ncbi:hypothetical protein OG585_25670 [Streptomyces sp. NBC_01340]|uniref:hypothetical protein n=1 Tax=unclassified Streptomyces TaxID=2593676 RepID=UPI00225302FA|nr:MULTISPECIES: hypothetical protein [unclassified Streptomyces]MCX4455988.1 hypothetical protein [Streptomyces sp. NBC_01719]MCX4495347.1 hypothetical protein [Streptomyces sp. NBC_01728]WSI40311.1 hypothetical protein OG585_25670 [Streptomyces sp. NBC_01340]